MAPRVAHRPSLRIAVSAARTPHKGEMPLRAGPATIEGGPMKRAEPLARIAAVTIFSAPLPSPVSAGTPSPPSERSGADAKPPDSDGALARYPRSPHQLTVNLGFGHWYGGTFGAPIGISTPALTVGVRPGVRFLELRAYYSVSLLDLELPTNGENSHVGFANFDLAATHELRVGIQRMVMGAGVTGGFMHTSQGVGPSLGATLYARYMLDVSSLISIGPYMDARALLYELPGSDVPIYDIVDGRLVAGHSDAHMQIGVAASFW